MGHEANRTGIKSLKKLIIDARWSKLSYDRVFWGHWSNQLHQHEPCQVCKNGCSTLSQPRKPLKLLMDTAQNNRKIVHYSPVTYNNNEAQSNHQMITFMVCHSVYSSYWSRKWSNNAGSVECHVSCAKLKPR